MKPEFMIQFIEESNAAMFTDNFTDSDIAAGVHSKELKRLEILEDISILRAMNADYEKQPELIFQDYCDHQLHLYGQISAGSDALVLSESMQFRLAELRGIKDYAPHLSAEDALEQYRQFKLAEVQELVDDPLRERLVDWYENATNEDLVHSAQEVNQVEIENRLGAVASLETAISRLRTIDTYSKQEQAEYQPLTTKKNSCRDEKDSGVFF